jgi:AcrR family transcriptional regulator
MAGISAGKREANKRDKITALCTAGLDLYLEQGIAKVTVDEIVQEAGVAKGSFYRYFENQEALVVAIMEPLREAVRQAIRAGADSLEAGIDPSALQGRWLMLAAKIGSAIFGHQKVARLYLQESRGPAIGARRPIAELVDELTQGATLLTNLAQEHGLSRSGLHPQVSSLIVVGAVEHLLCAFLRGEDLGDPAKIPSTLISIILDGVRPTPA